MTGSFPCGDFFSDFVLWRGYVLVWRILLCLIARFVGFGLRGAGLYELLLQFGDGLFRFVFLERLAVPSVFVLDEGNAFALERARQDYGGLLLRLLGCLKGLKKLPDIMSVDHQSVPSEC